MLQDSRERAIAHVMAFGTACVILSISAAAVIGLAGTYYAVLAFNIQVSNEAIDRIAMYFCLALFIALSLLLLRYVLKNKHTIVERLLQDEQGLGSSPAPSPLSQSSPPHGPQRMLNLLPLSLDLVLSSLPHARAR